MAKVLMVDGSRGQFAWVEQRGPQGPSGKRWGSQCSPQLTELRSIEMRNPLRFAIRSNMKSASPFLLCVASVLCMSACAVINPIKDEVQRTVANAPTLQRPYTEPPASAPHARVRVSTTGGVVRFFPGKACADLTEPKAGGVASRDFWAGTLRYHLNDQVLGMVGSAPPGLQSAEVRVPANEFITAVYEQSMKIDAYQGASCRLARAFVLPVGMQAQLTTRLVPGTPSLCELRLIDLSTGQELPSLPAPSQCAPASPSR